MLKIRLQRVGRIHEPTFRLVLTDSKNSTKSGKYLEVLGSYDARKGGESKFDTEKVTYWMSVGAQVSTTVHNLLVDKKIINAKKINKLPLKKAIVKEAPAEAVKVGPVLEEAKAEEALVEEKVPEVEAVA